MATSGSFNTTSVGNFYFTFEWSRTGYDSSKNEHYISYTLKAHNTAGSYRTVYLKSLYVNGTRLLYEEGTSGNGKSYYDGNVVKSGTATIASSNSSGDGSFSASFEAGVGVWPNSNCSGSGSWNLDRIPRYATSVQSLNTKTVNSIKMNWSSDSTIDYIWYSTNGGTNWTAVGSVNAKSGNYTISSLSPNTKYSIKTRVRRKDSQLTTDSTATSVTTYEIAKLTDTPNVNIGSAHTIKWTNPSGATTTLVLQKSNGTQVINHGTVTGTSKSVTETASTIYALIPSANSITLTYKLTTTANGTSYTNTKTCVFTVTNSNPTFSNYTFEDIGSVSTQLTGNPNIFINGYNILVVTISSANKAVAKNSAEMSKYRLVCGNQSVEENYSENEVSLRLNYITNMTFTVYAIDSRGNSTAVTKSASIWKNYSEPTMKSGSATRINGIGTDTILKFNTTFWNDNFGAVQNSITKCTYKYKRTTQSTYSNEIDITPTISGNNITFNSEITGDEGANGFDVSNSYNIQIAIKDRIKTITYDILLSSGTPILAIHKNGIAFGAPYDSSIGSLVQFKQNKYITTGGAINLNNSDIINGSSIYMNDESTGTEGINFLKQNGDKTNPDDYETLRGYRGNLYYDNIPIVKAPVGTIIVTYTNSNPSSIYGGTWSLFDKEFTPTSIGVTAGTHFTLNTTNCSAADGVLHRSGHIVWLRMNVTNKVALGDTTLEMLTFNFANLGFNSFTHTFTNVLGFSDGGNGAVAFTLNYSTGVLSTTDVIVKGGGTSVAAESAIYVYFTQYIGTTNMQDSACNKFYWRRTA